MNEWEMTAADRDTSERCAKAAKAHGVQTLVGEDSVVLLVHLADGEVVSTGDVICAWKPESARNVGMALLRAADLLDPPGRT